MTAIIILNWNGWKDTIECLKSLQNCKGNFRVVIADNGSTDESVEKINDYLENSSALSSYELICLEENYGFARGNNEAIRRMKHREEANHFLLLNNDTIVDDSFLTELENFKLFHSNYKILTPLIFYYNTPTTIWNAGGRQIFGFRKYYYANKKARDVIQNKYINISFVTGCALLFDRDLLDQTNGIFTERFFFGEEDFELCLRMKQKNIKMACVLTSKVYHKVSNSTKNQCTYGKIYIHYLNRFINMRLHLSKFAYNIWTIISIVYTTLLLKQTGLTFKQSFNMMLYIKHEATCMNSVNKDYFFKALCQKFL